MIPISVRTPPLFIFTLQLKRHPLEHLRFYRPIQLVGKLKGDSWMQAYDP